DHIWEERIGSHKCNDVVGKQEIGVGGQNKFSPRTADADIFSDHLKERNHIRVADRSMHFRRDFYESYSKTVRLDPELQNLMKPWSRRGIPFDHNELPRQRVPIGLFQKGLGKHLKSAKHVAPMVFFAGTPQHT